MNSKIYKKILYISLFPFLYNIVFYYRNINTFSLDINIQNFIPIMILLIPTLILSPIFEELIFRGWLTKNRFVNTSSIISLIIVFISQMKIFRVDFISASTVNLFNYLLYRGVLIQNNINLTIFFAESFAVISSLSLIFLIILFSVFITKIQNTVDIRNIYLLIILGLISSILFLGYHNNVEIGILNFEFLFLSVATLWFIFLQIQYNLICGILGHLYLNSGILLLLFQSSLSQNNILGSIIFLLIYIIILILFVFASYKVLLENKKI